MDGKEYPDYVLAAGMVEKVSLCRQNPDMSSSAFFRSKYPRREKSKKSGRCSIGLWIQFFMTCHFM
jgi:hypothetical protein